MAEPITLTTDGLLLNWLKEVGDSVKAGEVIAEIEADKATVEIEAPKDGVLLEQRAEVGAELTEGTVIAMLGAQGESAQAAGTPSRSTAQASEDAPPANQSAQAQAQNYTEVAPEEQAKAMNGNGAAVAATTPEGRIKISPVARRMADEKGINVERVQGSGPGGRIVKADIENYTPGTAAAPSVAANAPMTVPAGTQPTAPAQHAAPASHASAVSYGALPQGDDVEITDISRMRRRIADTTITSNVAIPHFFVTTSINMEPLMALRKQINQELESTGVKVSVNDLVVKATGLTLRRFPNLNTHYYGDKLVHHKRINVGIAVALPNNGLLYVVSRDADKTPLSVMAEEHAAMVARAREGRVKPEDIKGATFSTSNLGPFDVDHFSAIISPPEAGILAFGTAKKTPIVREDGTLGVGMRMGVTISVDHRVSDGAEGAQFLQEFKTLLENPMRLLV
ncbi:MAG: pyruvate dehydrogenase complex dihydrolipoamide acetyltransferase [Anaerolineae bacterium]